MPAVRQRRQQLALGRKDGGRAQHLAGPGRRHGPQLAHRGLDAVGCAGLAEPGGMGRVRGAPRTPPRSRTPRRRPARPARPWARPARTAGSRGSAASVLRTCCRASSRSASRCAGSKRSSAMTVSGSRVIRGSAACRIPLGLRADARHRQSRSLAGASGAPAGRCRGRHRRSPRAEQRPAVRQVAEAEIADDHGPEQQGVGEGLDDRGRRQLQGPDHQRNGRRRPGPRPPRTAASAPVPACARRTARRSSSTAAPTPSCQSRLVSAPSTRPTIRVRTW